MSKTSLVLTLIALSQVNVDSGVPQKSLSWFPFQSPDNSPSSLSDLINLSTNPQRNVDDNRNLSPIAPQVVGGTEATPHQFPFQISLQVRNYFGGYDHNCGGVIYDDLHIITGAHCVRGIHHKNLKVVAGEHELFNDEGEEQYRDILGYLFHPGFNPQTYENDIAIITLDYPLHLNPNIQPVRLPNRVMEYTETARTCGWGNNGFDNEQQLKLLYVDLYVYTQEECEDAWSGRITEGMMCAGGENGEGGKGSCNGDSGGALICKDDSDRDYLCGLVSWGSVVCGAPNLPTVFTSINSYYDWLHALLPPQGN